MDLGPLFPAGVPARCRAGGVRWWGMGGLRRAAARFRAVHLAVLGLVTAAALLGFVEIVLIVAGPVEPTWVVVLFPVLGGIYLTAGAVAWLRRPSNQMGALLVAGGLSWLAAALANTEYSSLIAVGLITATVPLAVIVHMLLAFPSGRLRDRASRLITLAGYADVDSAAGAAVSVHARDTAI